MKSGGSPQTDIPGKEKEVSHVLSLRENLYSRRGRMGRGNEESAREERKPRCKPPSLKG